VSEKSSDFLHKLNKELMLCAPVSPHVLPNYSPESTAGNPFFAGPRITVFEGKY
jgi:hypothetical protein